jgi:hypothetical protein
MNFLRSFIEKLYMRNLIQARSWLAQVSKLFPKALQSLAMTVSESIV